ncbi:hypothetical protein A4X03_0g9135 [Tilletia caries]|uniref:Uncharacterized protein n=1 Tax=Tilletia caries TaxID=13290 RepID=A0A8T8SCY5_9BASI|nr:hypothetical protein A4X03_0g9135 [Tilletia caries]
MLLCSTASQLSFVLAHLRVLKPSEFHARVAATDDYVGSTTALGRMDQYTVDARGRFVRTDENGEVEEMRFSYAAKGRSAFAFVNGKTGNAFPVQWASEATRPTTIVIETTANDPSMRRKRATEEGREYTCNVFTNAQQPRTWTIGCCLPPLNATAHQHLLDAVSRVGNRLKSTLLTPHEGNTKRHVWAQPSLGGGSYFPRVERALTVKGGDEREPGRMSDRDGDHDLLRTIGEQAALKYNTVPDVALLDTEEQAYWKIDWHLVHELPASTLWESPWSPTENCRGTT